MRNKETSGHAWMSFPVGFVLAATVMSITVLGPRGAHATAGGDIRVLSGLMPTSVDVTYRSDACARGDWHCDEAMAPARQALDLSFSGMTQATQVWLRTRGYQGHALATAFAKTGTCPGIQIEFWIPFPDPNIGTFLNRVHYLQMTPSIDVGTEVYIGPGTTEHLLGTIKDPALTTGCGSGLHLHQSAQASTFIKPNIPVDPAVNGGVISPTGDAACDAIVRITWGYPTGPICAEGGTLRTLTVGEHALSAVLSGSQVTVLGRNQLGYIYARETAGSSWGSWVSVQSGPTYGRPEVVDKAGELYIFFRDAEGGLSYKRRISGTWESVRTIFVTAATSSPVAAVDGDGDVLVGYLNASGGFGYSRYSGGSWTSGTVALSYVLTGQLAVATYVGNVYFFGLDQNGYLWVMPWIASLDFPAGWTCLCGTLSRGPSAVAYGGDLYVFGLDVVGGSWYRKLSGGAWGSWTNEGGVLASAHGSTSTSGALLFTGTDILGGSWTKMLTSGSFGLWIPLSGVVMPGHEVAPAGASAYTFSINSVGETWYRRWDGSVWDTWVNLGGVLQTE